MPVRHMATTNEGLIRAMANLAGVLRRLSPLRKRHSHFVTVFCMQTLLSSDAKKELVAVRVCIPTCAGHIVHHHIRSFCTCAFPFFFTIFLSIPEDERHFIFSKTLQNKQLS